MKTLTVAIFVLMVVAQWFVPLRMVFRQESVIAHGTTYRFKTQPIDPSDPFRGKYITLRFEAAMHKVDTASRWTMGETVYLTLEEDPAGFARIKDVVRTRPEDTSEYIQTVTGYTGNKGFIVVELPFDHFFLEESKASEAEKAYWQAATDTTQVAYAEVAVRNGMAALRDVKIDGKSIVAIVDELNE